jgi:hypothetical protein
LSVRFGPVRLAANIATSDRCMAGSAGSVEGRSFDCDRLLSLGRPAQRVRDGHGDGGADGRPDEIHPPGGQIERARSRFDDATGSKYPASQFPVRRLPAVGVVDHV